MPYTPEHRHKTRERILRSAALHVRRHGAGGAGVDRIMAGAGLTAGGFYAHFRKKDTLVATVVSDGLQQLSSMLFAGLENVRGVPFLTTVTRRYLSRRHRDDIDGGCIVAALLGELPRQSPEVRLAFEQGLQEVIARVSPRVPASATQNAHDRTVATLALFAGGIMLSRAVEDPALSNRILAACRRLAAPEAYAVDARMGASK
jgi:TetR/AcrR family transcriptional repressor of nem operon